MYPTQRVHLQYIELPSFTQDTNAVLLQTTMATLEPGAELRIITKGDTLAEFVLRILQVMERLTFIFVWILLESGVQKLATVWVS